ncbi:hypothetical protein CGL51_02595 [Pyrobaculum aerophilum]|uniref:P. aerophilum family 3 protein n=1 Tax=Pyrobaculum aerophilum TaxID=13773 RepID=A0A371R243_9CREN|nr:hypothetical protein CGL51_02595 [Pyrobaculum aerophilum]RFA99450.1 hypothetical protein CGL52_03585 [Pyrobaculum aerophilum]
MRLIGRFGLKSSFFLYLLNIPLYLIFFLWHHPLPYVGLVSGLTYLLAYFMACGRFLITIMIYVPGVLALLASALLGDVIILGGRLVELYFITAFFASLIYAATFGRGVGRALSVVLLLISVAIGGVLIVVIASLWRMAVPTLGFAPWLPEPQDVPIYVVLYEFWRKIHTYPKSVKCGRETATQETAKKGR